MALAELSKLWSCTYLWTSEVTGLIYLLELFKALLFNRDPGTALLPNCRSVKQTVTIGERLYCIISNKHKAQRVKTKHNADKTSFRSQPVPSEKHQPALPQNTTKPYPNPYPGWFFASLPLPFADVVFLIRFINQMLCLSALSSMNNPVYLLMSENGCIVIPDSAVSDSVSLKRQ